MKKKSLTNETGEVRPLTLEDIKKFKPAKEVLTEELLSVLPKRKPGQRGKQIHPKKEQVTLRLDKETLIFFKKNGRGWQTKINDALKQWVSNHHEL